MNKNVNARRTAQRLAAILMSTAVAAGAAAPALASARAEEPAVLSLLAAYNYRAVLSDVLAQMPLTVPAPVFGSVGGEWTVLSLARGGYFAPGDEYFESYYDRIAATIKQTADSVNLNGALHKSKSTENARAILALTAIGKDPADVNGVDLVAAYSENGLTWIKKQGINGPIFALIALDTNGYQTKDSTIRQQCIDFILSKQLTDGGWALTGTVSDPDITGMAMQALAPYASESAVSIAAGKAIDCMSTMQADNGGYASWGTANSESIAQIVTALCAWGIDPASDPRFIKNGRSPIDALLDFYVPEGAGFAHVLTSGGGYTGGEVNGMATDQAAYALVAYDRFARGMNSLYDMTDVVIPSRTPGYDALLAKIDGLDLKNAKQRTFLSLQSANEEYSKYIAGAEYLNLEPAAALDLKDALDDANEVFDKKLDAAAKEWKDKLKEEYDKIEKKSSDHEAIYKKALADMDEALYEEQLEKIFKQAAEELAGAPIRLDFTDVKESDWFFGDVRYAVSNGLFTGLSATEFGPSKSMTRAMLVTVLYRMAGEPYAPAASFKDVAAGSWYAPAVGWAASEGIVTGTGDGKFSPNVSITREQMAAILYRYAKASGGASLDGFSDGDTVSSYAKAPMEWAVGAGLITGSGGKLMPKGTATRAQVAAILHRFAGNE